MNRRSQLSCAGPIFAKTLTIILVKCVLAVSIAVVIKKGTIMKRTIQHLSVLAVVAAALIGTLFAAAPSIKSVAPQSGFPGSTVTITGANFGPTKGMSTVTFNGKPATAIVSWSDSIIKADVPGMSGPLKVVVTVNGVASNVMGFFALHRGK
jgi:hypothetical protein